MADAALVIGVDTALTVDQRGKVSTILTGVAVLDVTSAERIRSWQVLEGLAGSDRLWKCDGSWFRLGAVDVVNTWILHVALMTGRTTRLTDALSCRS